MRKVPFHFDSDIHHNPSCSKLPVSWQSKPSFRRINDLQHPYSPQNRIMVTVSKYSSKMGYAFQEEFALERPAARSTAAIGSVTQPYLLCLSGLPAWSAFPEEQIFLSCACWISSCLCHLPLPLPHSSVVASPWQQRHPAAWLIMQNKTVNPNPFFILFILMLILTEFNPQLP